MITNAMRLLRAAKVEFEVREYEVDESDLSGVHIAETLDISPDCMFKTLVAQGDKTGPLVFCLPVDREIDLRRAAVLTGNKKIEMVAVKDLLALTGYIRGGCSPIGMKKRFPTYIHESALKFDQITVSAGVRGIQLLLSRAALLDYLGAKTAFFAVGDA